MTYEKQVAVTAALYGTVKDMGDSGAPSGPMYAACITQGIALDEYMMIMNNLIRRGLITERNNYYYMVSK